MFPCRTNIWQFVFRFQGPNWVFNSLKSENGNLTNIFLFKFKFKFRFKSFVLYWFFVRVHLFSFACFTFISPNQNHNFDVSVRKKISFSSFWGSHSPNTNKPSWFLYELPRLVPSVNYTTQFVSNNVKHEQIINWNWTSKQNRRSSPFVHVKYRKIARQIPPGL